MPIIRVTEPDKNNIKRANGKLLSMEEKVKNLNARVNVLEQKYNRLNRNLKIVTDRHSDMIDRLNARCSFLIFLVAVVMVALVVVELKLKGLM